ncbi:hypothetical protein M408DRAFT_80442 [Serendipita vermifera MAFF 305830]|uniref:Sec39 domain-containing protein n=1 Tax=Serendipita vermifera MAFF 305830 TaxID=933852 RepID=A0A0C3AA74_SERVB|nr:hypothetical protein M408DRAFT_80442 [Serendipita vermifera MAFF 305830]
MSVDKWHETKDGELSPELVTELLEDIPDDLWVTAACAERIVADSEVAQVLVTTGLRRSTRLIESIRGSLASYEHLGDVDMETNGPDQKLVSYFTNHERERKVCVFRQILLDRQDRIQTYLLMANAWKQSGDDDASMDEEEDDPWADTEEETPPVEEPEAPMTLSEFLSQPLVDSAVILASERRIGALDILLNYHERSLFPYRFTILDSIPLYVQPSEYHHLLPANDFDTNTEIRHTHKPWREKPDWVEQEEAVDDEEFPRVRREELLTAEQITAWYTTRVQTIDSQSGLMDNALALLQHGASQGVPRLDELGEDLILLDRLIYESSQPPDPSNQPDWTLYRWRTAEPPQIIQAYLAYSTYDSIASDVLRLVLPYLSVLEAQAERAKKPDLELSNRLLYQYILQTPLELAVAIFENSKADIQRSYRIIRSDEDVARVAMAYLYGITNITAWPLMSRIFECQPDWGDDREDDDEAYATLTSLSTFVAPSTTRARATSEELLVFFKPLPASALSRLLDVLDVHLESGEILARWNVAAPLQWLLLSREDEAQQRARAVRMSRRSAADGMAMDETQWRSLFDDMIKLTSAGEGIKSAFGLLAKEEIARIFFTGLLSSGNFAVAKRIKGRGNVSKYLAASAIEEICLSVSREFYDNAGSGNLHTSEMKLAYECLSVAPASPAIQKERDFIEATSKICSFNVFTRPGIPITPLEIRLTKNRLDLIARVLSSTDDAFNHTNVILELSHKLGFKDDLGAEIKILSMVVDVALQHEDFLKAETTCERMMESARTLRASYPMDAALPAPSQEALEVAWRSCYQLGRQSEFRDTDRKLRLLGFALELCPTANTLDVLSAWRRIEADDIEERKRRSAARAALRPTGKRKESGPGMLDAQARALAAAGTLFGGLKGLSQGQEAATHMLNRVTANFPFSLGSHRAEEHQPAAGERDFGNLFSVGDTSPRPRVTEEVAAGAKQVLARGMGWLIGGDEEDG